MNIVVCDPPGQGAGGHDREKAGGAGETLRSNAQSVGGHV